MSRVLIAGMGNVLRGDDGFGPAVVEMLQQDGLASDDIRVTDIGTGGMSLVHELFGEAFDALVIIDCVDRGAAPGTLFVLNVTVPSVDSIPVRERHALATDMHQAGPDRALLVARAAGTLPPRVWLVGCQPAEVEELSMQLTAPVRDAVPAAVAAVRELLAMT